MRTNSGIRLLARILKVGVQMLHGAAGAMLLGGSGGMLPQKILKN